MSGDPRSDGHRRGGGHNHVQVARLPQRGGPPRTRWENWPPDGGVASRAKPRRKLVAKKIPRPAPQRAKLAVGLASGFFSPPRAVITGSLFQPSSQALTPPNFFFQPESRLAGGSELEMICRSNTVEFFSSLLIAKRSLVMEIWTLAVFPISHYIIGSTP